MYDAHGESRETVLPLLSLFSGAGGLDLGFELAGFEPRLAMDIDRAAVATYNFNRSGSRRVAKQVDLSKVEPEQVLEWWHEKAGEGCTPAGIIGGPPCQAFSVSNVHRLEEDPRARLPLAYARLLNAFNARGGVDFFLFENVAGLGHRPHGSSLEEFMSAFAAAGFEVSRFYLDAVRFHVPQFRRRMFIVGLNSARFQNLNFVPPEGDEEKVTVREAIGDLPEPIRHARGASPREHGLHPNHWCLNPRSKKFENGALAPGKMLGRSFRMLAWDEPSWTVAYGHREVHVHPNGKRRLSIYEAMILQGLPRTGYELFGTLTDQIRLVSDMVPPPLAYALASSIRGLLYPSRAADTNAQVARNGQAECSGLNGVHTVAPRSTSA